MKKKVQLNLGCGSIIAPGFINVDAFTASDSPDFRKGDIRALPFDANYADYILCDNVLEHLPTADVPIALYEMRRVLKVGGHAIIIVPDFSCLCRHWEEMEKGTFNPTVYQWVAETIYGNQIHEGEYHRTAMSPKYLNFVLRMVGFRKYDVIIYPTGGLVPQYPGIPKVDHESTRLRNDMIVVDVEKT